MGTDTLQAEAEHCLSYIYGRFADALQGRVIDYPLADIKSCRAFAETVTDALTILRSSESRLPPTALVLAMVRVCQSLINPPVQPFGATRQKAVIPRAFAYEMLDRLKAELPPTFDFALDQVGRIVAEAGTLQDATRIRNALLTYRIRQHGSHSSRELGKMVGHIWQKRYPEHAKIMIDDMAKAA